MAQAADKKAEKSYLSSAVESINPWAGGRSAAPAPGDTKAGPSAGVLGSQVTPRSGQSPGDHSTSHLYGTSSRNYPRDCPPLNVLWFHAVDIPKRKPQLRSGNRSKPGNDSDKTTPQPKKFVAFSASDSRSLEAAYQKLLEDNEHGKANPPSKRKLSSASSRHGRSRNVKQPSPGVRDATTDGASAGPRVPVNEDFLFDVDIWERELSPVYWLGPVYEVRRGTWFYQEGSTLKPCEENLAAQLEDGYLKTKPWLHPMAVPRSRSASASKNVTPKGSKENLQSTAGAGTAAATTSAADRINRSFRLFGTYMNSVATYQDANTVWLSSDSMLSWVTSTVYERFAGGGYMSGVKLVRGHSEYGKAKDEKRPSTPTTEATELLKLDEKQQRLLKRRSAPPSTKAPNADDVAPASTEEEDKDRESQLQRQLSSFSRDPKEREEEIRRREEREIQDDYSGQAGETQGREISHLVLVTHGIGQLLGLRMESVNFVHDVNVMRKTMKSVYSSSADLKALNGELGSGPGNCRVQVLPVCWRHLLDFPKQRAKGGEHDIGVGQRDEDEYPSLEDITIEGVAFARSLVSDLALDVLLYQSGYREQIVAIVLQEANRIFNLFKKRNPEFKGKVHVMGHSLGSAILFDLLCRQREMPQDNVRKTSLRFWAPQSASEVPKDLDELAFDFDVGDFYCLGSPIGLFQMLKGRTISARNFPNSRPSQSPLDPESVEDPFLAAMGSYGDQRVSLITGLPYSVSSPKVGQLFNIFHPSDPISYRVEPLVSPAMSSLKPQILPYTKKGIFGNVAPQGLSGIGVKVGQSMSGLWSTFSAGIASSLLNRSLGLSNEEVARMTASASPSAPAPSAPHPPGAGTNISAGGVIADAPSLGERADQRKRQLANPAITAGRNSTSGNDVTLIDDDLETLYSKFEKSNTSVAAGGEGETLENNEQEKERLAQKMRVEEAKVRALNRNGRVDYSIQESVLDYNPINTIASHMSYWADEDVNHFVLSQLLSNKQKTKDGYPKQIKGAREGGN